MFVCIINLFIDLIFLPFSPLSINIICTISTMNLTNNRFYEMFQQPFLLSLLK